MSIERLTKAARWKSLFVVLFSVLVFATDAAAQSSEQGRSGTTERSRVEQRGKSKRGSDAKKVEQSTRSRGSAPATRSRSAEPSRGSAPATRSRSAEPSRGSAPATRSRSAEPSRSSPSTRSRSAEPSRGSAPSTRSREAVTLQSRGNTTTREGSAGRSGQSRGSVERGRETAVQQDRGQQGRSVGTGRGATRGGGDAGVRQDRARSAEFEVDAGRTSRSGSRQEAGPARRPQADDRGTSGRAPRGASTDVRTVDRQPARNDVGSRRTVRYDRSPRYQQRDTWRSRYDRDKRYRPKHYKRRHDTYKGRHYYRPVVVRPQIHIDINWPWQHRYTHGWRPRYQYRQVVYVEAGWGRHQRRRVQVDVRTYYYHELRSATRDRADVDIYIERIELYENGRYLGEVHHVPEHLGRIRATVYRSGRVDFDRDVFIVGDSYAGFEMISTPYYNDFVLDAYRPSHGLRVGVVDLRRERVVPTGYSRLFDPYSFQGYVPVSLLPEDTGWLLDYGRGSFSGAYYEDDPYYYGGYSGYGNSYDDPYYGDDYYEEDYYEDSQGRPYYSVRSTVAEANFGVTALAQTYDRNFHTSFGAEINLRRETSFVRIK